MRRTVQAIFDGEVLRPAEPLNLEPNRCYRVTVEDEVPELDELRTGGVLDDIVALAQDLDLPPDFAQQHDHYLYGTPKR